MTDQPQNSTACASEANLLPLVDIGFFDAAYVSNFVIQDNCEEILRIDKDFNLIITDPDKVIAFWERNLEEYRIPSIVLWNSIETSRSS